MQISSVCDFFSAALPWIAMGLMLAIFFAKDGNNSRDNLGNIGMSFGMAIGIAVAPLFKAGMGICMSAGMLLGLIIGSMIKVETKEETEDEQQKTIQERKE